jgi:hypothetical protein
VITDVQEWIVVWMYKLKCIYMNECMNECKNNLW